jgi:luciferase family oxidoreductase group 1
MSIDATLSVLDLAPVAAGSTVGDALRSSIELVQLCERLGYHRFWVAEHHNMPGIASSSPAVLLAHLASVTDRIRLGSGGVMLPNHAPLVIAEQFGMLEALHPGRIDLGIGRAPGTDPTTARALRRGLNLDVDDFPQRFEELSGYFTGASTATDPFHRITAVPGFGHLPQIWMLGSSDYGARTAGQLGLPFSFAHHFAAHNTIPALQIYHQTFQSSRTLPTAYSSIGVSVVAADTDEEARWLAGSGLLSFLFLRQGRPGPLPTPQTAADYDYSAAEQAVIDSRLADSIVGSPQTVERRINELIASTRADELMITTMVHDPAARRHSYELVAKLASSTDDADHRAA